MPVKRQNNNKKLDEKYIPNEEEEISESSGEESLSEGALNEVAEQVRRALAGQKGSGKKKQVDIEPSSDEEEGEEEIEKAPPRRPERKQAPAPNPKPKRAAYRKKYKNAEEAHQARLAQMRAWRQNRKERSVTITLPDADTKGQLLDLLGFAHQKLELSPQLAQALAELTAQNQPPTAGTQ